MPLQLSIGHLSLTVPVRPFTPSTFAPYGDAIQNPRPTLLPPVTASTLSSLPYEALSANQGSAIKYQNVSRQRNLYDEAPSRIPAQPAMSMFVCRARPLIPAHELSKGDLGASDATADTTPKQSSYFRVNILERHPFTSQTFIPLSTSPTARYLVIVAPTLPSPGYPALPTPSLSQDVPGPGLPDLQRLEAFVATGDQAVTYAAGTWHAPMAVIGDEGAKIDFVVAQFMNGVSNEDVQEVELKGEDAEAGILAEVTEEKVKARL